LQEMQRTPSCSHALPPFPTAHTGEKSACLAAGACMEIRRRPALPHPVPRASRVCRVCRERTISAPTVRRRCNCTPKAFSRTGLEWVIGRERLGTELRRGHRALGVVCWAPCCLLGLGCWDLEALWFVLEFVQHRVLSLSACRWHSIELGQTGELLRRRHFDNHFLFSPCSL
jgi:hypothetical protein